jgi:nucleoporin NDC1
LECVEASASRSVGYNIANFIFSAVLDNKIGTKQSEIEPKMKLTINNMSYREIISWRATAAVFWSFVIQTAFLLMILFLMNFNIWHPVLWIQQSAGLCLSLGTWVYMLPLGFVMCAQGIVCCKDYMVASRYCGTRFAIFCNMFSPRTLIMGTLYAVISGCITWIYLSLLRGKYGQMAAVCSSDDNKTCLIEGHLFLMLNGFWRGIYFFVHDYIFSPRTLMFPVIQQFKFLQVKAELQSLMKQAMIDAISPTMYFIVIYFWNRGAIRDYVCDFMDYNTEDKSLETLFELMNISLVFYALCFSGIFIFTINTVMLMFRVNLTEHLVFPVTPVYKNSDGLTLHQSMAMIDIPIIQHLGYLDLKILAEKDHGRREELFTLSHPGGHPYNWNAVVEESLKLITKFTEDVNKANTETQPVRGSKEYTVARDYLFSKSSAVVSTGNHNTSISGMRNMSLRAQNLPDIYLYQSSSNIVQFQSPPLNISQESVIRTVKLYATQALDALCKKPGISFIFGELPDAKVRYYLAQCQPVIWAVQSLSHLAAASFKEDRYGVVQKDLPAIIISLFQLKEALDKLQKIGNYKRSQKTEHHDIKMKAALRSAVKRSLYCVCITFGDHVKELPLTKEVLQQLQDFLIFREG